MQKCNQCGYENPDNTKFCGGCGASLSGVTGQLSPDTVLEGRYIIVKTIGRGGMGAVYLALDTRLNHMTVAIKEMSFQASGGDISTAIAAFQKEASLLTNLHHPALPTVRDFFSRESNRWYLVMDYIEGETLQDIAQRRGPIPEGEILDWARQLCDILDYLHNQNPPVIFRDLKPSNIMLTSAGEIKLIDFGIARHFRPGSTSDTAAFISSGFAPPEQYGANQTDARSDIYALGATLHYLLTGINPAPNPFSFDSPSKHARVSLRMDSAIMKALKLKAEERPQDVKEMLGLLPKGAVRPAVTPTPETSKNRNPVNQGATTPLPVITPTSSTNLLTGPIPDVALDALPKTTPIQKSVDSNEANLTSAVTKAESEDKTVADLTAAKTTPMPAESISPFTTESSTKRKSRPGIIAAMILLLLLIPGGWLAWSNVQDSGPHKPPVHNTASSDTYDNNFDASLVSSGDKEGIDLAEDGLKNNNDENTNNSKDANNNPQSVQEVSRSQASQTDLPIVTSGVTIIKIENPNAEPTFQRGIDIQVYREALSSPAKENARYVKCYMSGEKLNPTIQEVQQFVDEGKYGSHIVPFSSSYQLKMFTPQPWSQIYGNVIFLDDNYKVVGCYQGIGK